ncbi:recombinase family protein [Halomicrococcus sp. NG-SE-24]|uniref:recombinase family protein n=1 Tax=Halomicrococcus sp. NG-SE-24 TaxID=3436928 RepID=UPI003D999D90
MKRIRDELCGHYRVSQRVVRLVGGWTPFSNLRSESNKRLLAEALSLSILAALGNPLIQKGMCSDMSGHIPSLIGECVPDSRRLLSLFLGLVGGITTVSWIVVGWPDQLPIILPLMCASYKSNEDDDTSDDQSRKGLGYVRLSDPEQEEGTGEDRQIDTIHEIADKEDIELVDIIRDIGETGREFDRNGLRELLTRAQREENKYVVVEDSDRLGRRAPQTLSMVDLIQRECDVIIVTPVGEMDTSQISGLSMVALQTIVGDIENRNRAHRLLSGKINAFKNRNWPSWFRYPPYGYTEDGNWDDENADEKWIKIDEDEKEVSEDLAKFFDREAKIVNGFAATIEYIERNHGVTLSRSQVKRILTDPVFIGRPTVSGESIGDDGEEAVVEDDSLQIIDEELFESNREKVQKIHEKYSTPTNEESIDLDYLLTKYGIEPVVTMFDCVEVRCPEDDCDGQTRHYDRNTLDDESLGEENGKTVHVWECRKCGSRKTFPNHWELFCLQNWETIQDERSSQNEDQQDEDSDESK